MEENNSTTIGNILTDVKNLKEEWPKVKSLHQKNLEAEGWEFLTNTYLEFEDVYDEKFGDFMHRELPFPKSANQLRKEWLNRGFKDILITDAYDINGNFLCEMKAIYAKREKGE